MSSRMREQDIDWAPDRIVCILHDLVESRLTDYCWDIPGGRTNMRAMRCEMVV